MTSTPAESEIESLRAAIAELQDEVRRERNAALRVGHRQVGGTVHHIDGDPSNNEPENLIGIGPALCSDGCMTDEDCADALCGRCDAP